MKVAAKLPAGKFEPEWRLKAQLQESRTAVTTGIVVLDQLLRRKLQ